MAKVSRAVEAARVLLGLVFLVSGLNGCIHGFPQRPMDGQAAWFMEGLAAGGYLLPFVLAVQAIAGLALLSRRFVPLALVALAPVIVNIVGFHLWLGPSGLGFAAVVSALDVFLAWSYRGAFRSLLKAQDDVTLSRTSGDPVHRFLEVSLIHLPTRWRGAEIPGCVSHSFAHGLWVWVPDAIDGSAAAEGGAPAEVVRAQTLARALGCDYVCFDEDAARMPELPVFEGH